jgi:hypothetical protein
MTARTFTRGLARVIEKARLPERIKSEAALEKALVPHVRRYVRSKLDLPEAALRCVLYYHGNPNWSESKPFQHVAILGRYASGDIFIRHPKIGSVLIELKLAKLRKPSGADSLPGSLQRSLGQSLVFSMRHPHTICCVVFQGSPVKRRYDKTCELTRKLWKERQIRLILRPN